MNSFVGYVENLSKAKILDSCTTEINEKAILRADRLLLIALGLAMMAEIGFPLLCLSWL